MSVRGARSCIVCAIVACLWWGERVDASNDLLTLPATPSDKVASSMLLDVVYTGERMVAVGERGHILLSEDDGQTWTQADVPTSVTLTAVYFPTPQKGWAVGHDGVVLHSSDGGAHWDLQLDGSRINDLVLAQVQTLLQKKEDELEAAPEEAKRDLRYEVEDLEFFANDASAAAEEGPARPFLDVWFRNEREGFAVGSFGLIVNTENGGATWQPVLDRIENPEGFHYYGIAKAGDALFIAGEEGMLFRSDDDGATWERLDSPYEGSFFGIVGGVDGGLVVAFGLRGNAFLSLDGGRTWETAGTPRGAALTAGAVLSDGSMLLVGTSGMLFRRMDHGTDFVPLVRKVPGSVSAAETGKSGQIVVVGMRGTTTLSLASANP